MRRTGRASRRPCRACSRSAHRAPPQRRRKAPPAPSSSAVRRWPSSSMQLAGDAAGAPPRAPRPRWPSRRSASRDSASAAASRRCSVTSATTICTVVRPWSGSAATRSPPRAGCRRRAPRGRHLHVGLALQRTRHLGAQPHRGWAPEQLVDRPGRPAAGLAEGRSAALVGEYHALVVGDPGGHRRQFEHRAQAALEGVELALQPALLAAVEDERGDVRAALGAARRDHRQRDLGREAAAVRAAARGCAGAPPGAAAARLIAGRPAPAPRVARRARRAPGRKAAGRAARPRRSGTSARPRR